MWYNGGEKTVKKEKKKDKLNKGVTAAIIAGVILLHAKLGDRR